MKIYVKAYEETDGVTIIKSVHDMTDYIHNNGLIDSAIDWANDTDKLWEYDTPESFSAYSEEWLERIINERIDEGDIEVIGDPISLISDEIRNELREKASSGDFDTE